MTLHYEVMGVRDNAIVAEQEISMPEMADDKKAVMAELEGIRSGAVVRPEPLFHRRAHHVIDTHYNSYHNVLRNGVEETEFQNLKLISLDKLFNNKHEIFLGFGIPNVYLTIPNENGNGYSKFAAYMLWRQTSAVLDTKGRVQSGFLVRFRNLPEGTLEMLRKAMLEHSGKRHVSCAYANACVLNSAHFTSGGTDLRNHFGARAIFQQIFEKGLEFRGQPVTHDFIRTTPLTLEEHFSAVRKKELTSLGRACHKTVNACLTPHDNIRAPLLPVNDVPMMPTVVGNSASLTLLEISRPSFIGATMRKLWGSHTLFKAIPDREQVDVDNYLPNTLQAFPIEKPNFVTRIKKNILFSWPVVMFIRSQMASGWDNHGYFSAAALSSMMSVDPKKENKYNVVITGDCLIGMHNSVGIKFVDWLLSKHVLMSGYDDDVRFAGEIWMEHRNEGLVLHVSNNSGTYLPTDEQLTATGQYVAAALPGLRVELHPNPAKADSLVLDPNRDQDTFFTFKRILLLALGLMLGLGFLLFVPSKVN